MTVRETATSPADPRSNSMMRWLDNSDRPNKPRAKDDAPAEDDDARRTARRQVWPRVFPGL
jgi:hypothetical protein